VNRQAEWWRNIPKDELTFITKITSKDKGKDKLVDAQTNLRAKEKTTVARTPSIISISSAAIDPDTDTDSEGDIDKESGTRGHQEKPTTSTVIDLLDSEDESESEVPATTNSA
jgi:hypothetical protein